VGTCLGLPPAAQGIDPINQGCQVLGVQWICDLMTVVADVRGVITGFYQDLTGFGQSLLDDWLTDALAVLGQQVQSPVLEAALLQVRAAVQGGPVMLRDTVAQVARQLRTLRHAGRRAPPYSPDWWGDEAARRHPNLAVADEAAQAEREKLVVTSAESAAVHAANLELAELVADAAPMQTALIESGIRATQLVNDARTTTSTRAALVTLTEGVAELLRQDVALQATVIEHLRVLAQQQVMTTWQLHLAVTSLVAQNEAEVRKREAALQTQVRRAYEAGAQLGMVVNASVGSVDTLVNPDLTRFRWREVGW
jgi:hypothetical protein